MYCPKCGTEIEKEDVFCQNCGIKLGKGRATAQGKDQAPKAQEPGRETRATKPKTEDTRHGTEGAGPQTAGKSFISGTVPWLVGAGGVVLAVGIVILLAIVLLVLFIPRAQVGPQQPATGGQQPVTGTPQPAGGTWGTQQPATGNQQPAGAIGQNLYGNWLATGEQGKRLMGFSVKAGMQQKAVCTFINYENKQYFSAYCTSQGNTLTMLDDTNIATNIWYYLVNNSLFMMLPAGNNNTIQVLFTRTAIDLLQESAITITKSPAGNGSRTWLNELGTAAAIKAANKSW